MTQRTRNRRTHNRWRFIGRERRNGFDRRARVVETAYQ